MANLEKLPQEEKHLIKLVHLNKAEYKGYYYYWCSDCKGWIKTEKI